ncbi:MAG: hypothetical protein Q8L73_05540 [Methylotenera sp.]|nr:hypothetical protein [Methylotenera sp.]
MRANLKLSSFKLRRKRTRG